MKTATTTILCAAALAAAATAQEAAPSTLNGKITEVTLYQGAALVTRLVDLPADRQGAFEIVVSPLPTTTDPASVFADHAKGVEVRAVACRTRPPDDEEQMKGKVAQLDEAIRQLNRKISTSRNEIALRRIRQEYLKNLGHFIAPAAQQEMTHGVLQSEELEKLTRMHFREYETASQEIMALDIQIKDDSRKLDQLTAERRKLAAGPPVTYDAVLYLDKKTRGPATLQLNYLVKDCGWTPIYNVRGDTGKSEVEIEFNALIHQVSGEDWKNTRLSLSTASPTVSAYNPRLSPLYVRATSSGRSQRQTANAAIYNKALQTKKNALAGQQRSGSFNDMANANFLANESAASVQLIELSERLSELRLLRQATREDDLSIEYTIGQPVSLVSRREAQTVPVLSHRGPAKFYYVAAPILTPAVFREAELLNTAERDLLGGQVNVFLDGQFTGRTDIPTIARGRSFALGFGVDGQLRARRNVVDRTETVQGGNRKVTVTCEIVIDSYKDKKVEVRLRERTPFMEEAASLRVSIDETSRPLSTDPDYLRFEKSKGILRWDLPVKPGAGKDATTLRYTYSLEFDKNLTLQDISNERKSRLRSEFLHDAKEAIKR